jgi:hypothetical protein
MNFEQSKNYLTEHLPAKAFFFGEVSGILSITEKTLIDNENDTQILVQYLDENNEPYLGVGGQDPKELVNTVLGHICQESTADIAVGGNG